MLGAFQSTVSAYQKRSTRDDNHIQIFTQYLKVYINSLRLGQELQLPHPQNIALTYTIFSHLRYPRRNFERNQLLDGSISLSPLFQNKMNELHVSIT